VFGMFYEAYRVPEPPKLTDEEKGRLWERIKPYAPTNGQKRFRIPVAVYWPEGARWN
jgi:hypothetical protein